MHLLYINIIILYPITLAAESIKLSLNILANISDVRSPAPSLLTTSAELLLKQFHNVLLSPTIQTSNSFLGALIVDSTIRLYKLPSLNN